jgi:hypothetical protein
MLAAMRRASSLVIGDMLNFAHVAFGRRLTIGLTFGVAWIGALGYGLLRLVMAMMLSPMTRSRNAFRRGRRGARTSSTSAYFVTSPRVGREYIDLQLNAVRVTPPVSHMAAALIPTFGRLYGTLDAFCATDHDGLLKAPGRMTVEAVQIFEKAHSISGHRCKSL